LYACMFGKKVTPKEYAVFVENREIEKTSSPSFS
jgi:hypothetical protein